MELYFEEYKDTCFAPEEIISFNEALKHFETINDNEFIELIKRHQVRLFDVVRPITQENGENRVYCSEVDITSINPIYNIKTRKILINDIERLADKVPALKWKVAKIYDYGNNASEIARLKEENEQLLLSLKTKEIEVDEYKKKLTISPSLEGISNATAQRWAEHVETAVKIAFYCVNHPKKYSEEELMELSKAEFGNKLAKKALEALKRGLPEEFRCGRGESRTAEAPSNPPSR